MQGFKFGGEDVHNHGGWESAVIRRSQFVGGLVGILSLLRVILRHSETMKMLCSVT